MSCNLSVHQVGDSCGSFSCRRYVDKVCHYCKKKFCYGHIYTYNDNNNNIGWVCVLCLRGNLKSKI